MNKILETFNLKIIIILLCFQGSILSLNANNTAKRDIKISLNLDNVTLSKAFEKIEKLTELKFFYKTKDVDLNAKVSINAIKQSIAPILSELFKGKALKFKLYKDKIIIKKNKLKYSNIDYSLTGKIIDKNTKKIIPHCNIVIQETSKGVSSSESGSFTLNNVNSFPVKLIISHISYEQQIITLKKNSDLILELTPKQNNLKEVFIKSKKRYAINSRINKANYSIVNTAFDKYGRPLNRKRFRNVSRYVEISKSSNKDSYAIDDDEGLTSLLWALGIKE